MKNSISVADILLLAVTNLSAATHYVLDFITSTFSNR